MRNWWCTRRVADWLAVAVFGWIAWSPLQLMWQHGISGYVGLLALFYLLLIVIYLLRPPPRVAAEGWLERYFPLAVTFAPMVLLRVEPDPMPNSGAMVLCTSGIAFCLWGLIYLRGNFSIMVEGRQLVVAGPYRWLRHPIYGGEIVTLIGLMWLSPHWPTILVASLIVVGQWWRSWLEERKLCQVFGMDYERFRQGSWWLPLPALGVLSDRGK
ncbi:MAG: methyltransferase [Mariprofundales bacterium]